MDRSVLFSLELITKNGAHAAFGSKDVALIAVSFRYLILPCGKNTLSITSAHRYLPDFCVAPRKPLNLNPRERGTDKGYERNRFPQERDGSLRVSLLL